MAKKRTKPAKKKRVKQLPRSPDYKLAQQSLVQSSVLSLLSDQSRTQGVLRGAFGAPRLRSSGAAGNYNIKKPKGDKGWKNPYG